MMMLPLIYLTIESRQNYFVFGDQWWKPADDSLTDKFNSFMDPMGRFKSFLDLTIRWQRVYLYPKQKVK